MINSMIWKTAIFLAGVIVIFILLFIIAVFIFTAYQQYMKHHLVNDTAQQFKTFMNNYYKWQHGDLRLPKGSKTLSVYKNMASKHQKDGGSNGTEKD